MLFLSGFIGLRFNDLIFESPFCISSLQYAGMEARLLEETELFASELISGLICAVLVFFFGGLSREDSISCCFTSVLPDPCVSW